jgi:hypothetical protein
MKTTNKASRLPSRLPVGNYHRRAAVGTKSTNMPRNPKAAAALAARKAEIDSSLAAIAAAIASLDESTADWGHAGDAAYAAEKLSELETFLNDN